MDEDVDTSTALPQKTKAAALKRWVPRTCALLLGSFCALAGRMLRVNARGTLFTLFGSVHTAIEFYRNIRKITGDGWRA